MIVSRRLISISFLSDVSGSSIKTDSGPFAPLDDPGPSNAALTFFRSLPLPGRASNSAFLLVPPCTCISTSDSCKFGTLVFLDVLAFAAISFLNVWKSVKFFFPD
ncbi:hypothetical protein DEO72_LG4g317 [Vigna unguiculata]|uniref:Uncharacterized protein n=1 Tax=Vigna unguiculata TaxID=3917 RepID=A0A4D6LLJ1_VIGUN|nr:hypothetical protein DEO72_LG4g317 [Vigna unguiculata]